MLQDLCVEIVKYGSGIVISFMLHDECIEIVDVYIYDVGISCLPYGCWIICVDMYVGVYVDIGGNRGGRIDVSQTLLWLTEPD